MLLHKRKTLDFLKTTQMHETMTRSSLHSCILLVCTSTYMAKDFIGTRAKKMVRGLFFSEIESLTGNHSCEVANFFYFFFLFLES